MAGRQLRIYDCRHAAATTWLRASVPLGEVAKRLGHSVETLVSTYVGALTGDEDLGTLVGVSIGDELLEERRRRRRAGDPRLSEEGREILRRVTRGDLQPEFQAALDADLAAADELLGVEDSDRH